LLAGFAFGQAAPPATPPAAAVKAEQNASPTPDKAPEVKVGPDDAVITVKDFCPDTTLQGDACKTVITRTQFEKLADALQPSMPPARRQQLANFYAQVLRMSVAAEKRGLDKGPTFDEMMRFARIQTLAQILTRTLQEDSGKVSDADIEDYYKKNEASYEQATFARIYVPRTKQIVTSPAKPKADAKDTTKPGGKASANTNVTPPPPTEAQKKAAEEAMTKLADTLRARAVAGEDPEKLQKEAHAAAGLSGDAPSTKLEKTRRITLPANQQSVMDLKPGEVSEVLSIPNGGYYIYKLISKETIPLDTVKKDIQNILSKQRLDDSMKGFKGDVDFNDAYFGPAQKPGSIMGGRLPVPQAPKHD
jgi:bifunctional DNA-binding transcriptional regulator/antitoxin component of YhaV-PrlF toxin-antitoxin module